MTGRADPTGTIGAVVLCGGTSRRFGGGDKTAGRLGEATVLDRLLADLPADWPVVCVGEPRPLRRTVAWTREEPPSGGPLAGVAAGLAALPDEVDRIVVAAGDQPFAGGVADRLAAALDAAAAEIDTVAARQPDGRAQLLLAAYRRGPLTRRLESLGDAHDGGVHRVLGDLRVEAIDLGPDALLDVDTPADLDEARRRDGDGSPERATRR